ncbi:hypothetical protein WOLCODRAFT_107936 [Wolfiporia cocos MD-104 SS10]|uniref:Uncharacterized protein n=1 Tax=Wolfiporia cocos (strain MD-104) TaxID=742152 RepID=A0A2H3J805_WOLCO|nr:hypothetical protein WOLCODRAFT_107936 [Wolfiporia cocos MD-104 SS10]
MSKAFSLLGMGPRSSAARTLQLAALAALALAAYVLYTTPLLSHPLRALAALAPQPRVRASCPPRAYANGSWVPRATVPVSTARADLRMHAPEDALAFAGFDGCASSREFWWHLAADKESLWDRFPGVTSWEWMPAEDCDLRPFSAAALVKDLVETGGWLLIGGERPSRVLYSVTENHFFSLSCLLYPHVRATPNYTENPYFDRAWPQHLYLDPSSPLLPALSLPRGFSIADTPLVTFRRVDLLLDKEELEALHAERYTASGAAEDASGVSGTAASAGELPPLFSEEAFWSLSPAFYVRELLLAPAPLRYGTLVISTGGHWTTTLLSGLADASLPANGIENVIAFFGRAMEAWAARVQRMLDEHREGERRKSWWARSGGAEKRVVVRAYLPGHEDCHDEREPWTAWKPYRWNWYNWANIGEMNGVFESVLASLRFPDIHFLPIDRPALLRPDAHVASDCLHIMTGAGVLEGWTHYIWQFVSRELPGRIR